MPGASASGSRGSSPWPRRPFRSAPAEFVAVIGPNGAGKSTLFNCLTGVLRPDSGSVTFDGRSIDRMRPSKRAKLGIGRTFQRIELFGGMTVCDHLLVADRARTGRGGLFSDLFRPAGPPTTRWSAATACSTWSA